MSEAATIAGIITATAALVAAFGGVAKIRASGQQRTARVKDAGRSSSIFPPAPSPHASRDDVEALEEQVVALSVKLGRVEERQAACDADVRRIEVEQDAQRDRIHEVEMKAVERVGQVGKELAELSGAIKQGPLSQRGGRR